MIVEYKNKILSFYKENRRMPGYTEIMELVGFKSKNSVFKLVNKLVEQGILSKDSRGRLIPNTLTNETPLLGLVEAGFPTVAEETNLDTLNIDDYLIRNKDSTYLLEVKGDSMIDAGIQEGDLVVAERTEVAKDGDIVIASVDDGWTMKYLRKKGTTIYLQPANKDYDDIYPEQSLKIVAVVKGVVRKY